MFTKEIIGMYKNETKGYYVLHLAYHQDNVAGFCTESVYCPFSSCPVSLALGDKVILHRDFKGYLKGIEKYE